MFGTDYRLAASPCLHCGRELNGAASVGEDAAPEPGAATVCFFCGNIMVFADDLTLRNLTDAEAREIAGDRRVLAIQAMRALVGPKKAQPKINKKGRRP